MGAEAALGAAPEVVGEAEQRDRGDAERARAPGALPPPRATSAPTSGSRRPRWLIAVGPQASTASSSCRPRWAKPPASRPVARCRSGSSRSSTRRPARTASIVIRTSQPKPGASGKQASRAAGESARWPESGSRASKPLSVRTSARAARLAIPKPPPCRSANAAIARSAPSSSGARSPSRSASQSSSAPGGASRSASVSAWPLPSRGSRTTRAPARRAAAAVESREPSSATTISASGNARPQRLDRLPDPRLLVPRGDQDDERLSHPRRRLWPAAAAERRRSAESFTPYWPGG